MPNTVPKTQSSLRVHIGWVFRDGLVRDNPVYKRCSMVDMLLTVSWGYMTLRLFLRTAIVNGWSLDYFWNFLQTNKGLGRNIKMQLGRDEKMALERVACSTGCPGTSQQYTHHQHLSPSLEGFCVPKRLWRTSHTSSFSLHDSPVTYVYFCRGENDPWQILGTP